MISNIPDELSFETQSGKVRFTLNGLSTNWMGKEDSFIRRIDESSLNKALPAQHLTKEIEIKNTLDEGIGLLQSGKYQKAIERFDEVLFYDPEYGEALLNKSYSLRGQKHCVKALRLYKRGEKCDDALKDVGYHKALLKEANGERDKFPKLKSDIYAGDEHFKKGEYENAIDSYNRALENPSKFKDKILFKLLNKKATALLELKDYNEALDCFKDSYEVFSNDYATFGQGCCEHELGFKITGRFKTRLGITKRQMLKQAQILNESGYLAESLCISDFLFKNHFKVDDFYLELLNARKYSMKKLNMDLSEIEYIFNQISL